MTGIGFLGAGLIFSSKRGGVKGITTAATVFTTAAMGVATGLGFQLVAGGLTLIVIIILRSTHMIDKALYSADKDEYID
jgi:putative Mg2+ transporter-C (MgtC) family protein